MNNISRILIRLTSLSVGRIRVFYVVCFDVVDDRARARVAKVLKEYGVRVQKSVFECGSMTGEAFLKMKARLDSCIDDGEDTVRYYLLCRDCLKKMEHSGVGETPDPSTFRVV